MLPGSCCGSNPASLYLALCMSTSLRLSPASPGSLARALTEQCKVEERPKSIPSRLLSLRLGSAFLPAVELPEVCFVWGAVPGLVPHSPRRCPAVGTSVSPVPAGAEPGRCSHDKAPPSKADQSFCRFFFSPTSTAQSINCVKIFFYLRALFLLREAQLAALRSLFVALGDMLTSITSFESQLLTGVENVFSGIWLIGPP